MQLILERTIHPPLVRHLDPTTCFIWVLHMFHAYVWKSFIRMLHMFHTYVASVSSGCCICSTMATHVFPWCFIRMLQVFHLDIAKIDMVLHMLQ